MHYWSRSLTIRSIAHLTDNGRVPPSAGQGDQGDQQAHQQIADLGEVEMASAVAGETPPSPSTPPLVRRRYQRPDGDGDPIAGLPAIAPATLFSQPASATSTQARNGRSGIEIGAPAGAEGRPLSDASSIGQQLAFPVQAGSAAVQSIPGLGTDRSRLPASSLGQHDAEAVATMTAPPDHGISTPTGSRPAAVWIGIVGAQDHERVAFDIDIAVNITGGRLDAQAVVASSLWMGLQASGGDVFAVLSAFVNDGDARLAQGCSPIDVQSPNYALPTSGFQPLCALSDMGQCSTLIYDAVRDDPETRQLRLRQRLPLVRPLFILYVYDITKREQVRDKAFLSVMCDKLSIWRSRTTIMKNLIPMIWNLSRSELRRLPRTLISTSFQMQCGKPLKINTPRWRP